MIKLGVNSVLYVGHDLATAFQHIAWAGYDGIELSAIKNMCEHLELDNWRAQKGTIQRLAAEHKLALLSMEVASLDEDRLTKAFEAGQGIGVPVINVGPGGKSGVEEDLVRQIGHLAKMAQKAEKYGVALCCKAHVGQSIFDTPTTQRAMKEISSPAFGIDMDPSHIWRAKEDPAKALSAVLSRAKHIHIRDCKGPGPGPGEPCDQACGRGDIDLGAYFRTMVAGKYDGPVCLEVIGAGKYELPRRDVIAAESYGYMNACLKALGAR
jgi:sugar phosphate isomerase/epimerase